MLQTDGNYHRRTRESKGRRRWEGTSPASLRQFPDSQHRSAVSGEGPKRALRILQLVGAEQEVQEVQQEHKRPQLELARPNSHLFSLPI